MKFTTTAAIAACFAHVNALRVQQTNDERAQLWEVCGGPGMVNERQCVTGLTCSGYSETTEMKICKYAQKGEKCGNATGDQQVKCEPNTRLECVASTNQNDTTYSVEICTKEKPSDVAWDTAGHFAKSDFFEDTRSVDPEVYYGVVEEHLYKLDNGAWNTLVGKFVGQNEDEVAELISDTMVGLMRQHKEVIDTEIEKI